MKVCAACHTDLPKDSYSKKQWKLDEYQRRCKVCTADNREVQPAKQNNNDPNTNEIIKALDSMYLEGVEKKIRDEELFKQPPPKEDCPICFLRLPTLHTGYKYKTCCGKVICCGCAFSPVYDNQGNVVAKKVCPFCRVPTPYTDEEGNERLKKRVDAGDAMAIHNQGCYYRDGWYGCPQDHKKALALYHLAAELGNATAHCNIGSIYHYGRGGVEVDRKKARHYFGLAAMGGDETARHNLGCMEASAGNWEQALKHFMIAIRDGRASSLDRIKELYSKGNATKEDYTKALQAYQTYLSEIKSPQRDKAAAVAEDYRYYV